jgi:predicted lipoprotein with Yx(FWY)xxD motif
MKKGVSIAIAAVVIIVLVILGVAHSHKMTAKTTTSTSKVVAVNNAVLKTKTSASLGQYLTTSGGKALYTYSGDSSGVSNCTGSCLSAWPAYQATSSSAASLPKGVSTIKRTDNGQTQFTYNGMPLYTFASDGQGQVTGNGVSGFSIATPAAASSSTTNTTTQTQSQSNTGSSSNYPY